MATSLICEHCEQPFERRSRGPVARFCSASCRVGSHRAKYEEDGRAAQWYATSRSKFVPKAVTARPCAVCGADFLAARDDARTCGTACRKRHATIQSAPYVHARRAKIRGGQSEKFSPQEIFRRDGYQCYLCGELTDPEAPRYHPTKTTLEHVFPLSRGGAHTRENTRCACLRCNLRKGTKPLEVANDARSGAQAQ